ncbi:hypothetical protein, partial [Candidatus Accumulibacter vicinus]
MSRSRGKSAGSWAQPERLRIALAWLVGALLLHPAMASATGSVYVSYAADGVPSYASQRLDPSYRLLIRGENPPQDRGTVSR